MASDNLFDQPEQEMGTIGGSQEKEEAPYTWYQRTFSKIRPGSVRGSMFTLVSTAIGAGCLSLPGKMAASGIFLHLIILFVVAAVAYLSIVSIAKAAEHYNTYQFSDLITKALGRRWGILIDCIIIIYIYGTVIGYQILVGLFVPSILQSFSLHGNVDLIRDLSMVIINVAIIIPLGMLKNLSALRFASIVSVIALVMIAIVLIAELPFFNHHYNDLNYFDVNIDIFSTFAVTLYAFVCHCNVPIVHNEMMNRSVRRMSKAALRAVLIVLAGYFIISIFGYLSVPKDSPSIITQRKTPPGIHDDWVMVVARIIFGSTIIVAIPINSPPFRGSIAKLCMGKDRPSNLAHILLTLFLLITTLGIAIAYPAIIFLFNFLGGFCASFLVLLIPGLLHFKLSGKPWSAPSNLLVLGVSGFLTLAGFTSVIISIVELV